MFFSCDFVVFVANNVVFIFFPVFFRGFRGQNHFFYGRSSMGTHLESAGPV